MMPLDAGLKALKVVDIAIMQGRVGTVKKKGLKANRRHSASETHPQYYRTLSFGTNGSNWALGAVQAVKVHGKHRHSILHVGR